MSKETLHISVDSELKKEVDETLKALGMTTKEAVNIYLHQIILKGGIPFNINIPKYNAETIAAMDEAIKIATDEKVKGYTNVEDLMNSLESE
jgi:DNA-damage-inducible protein J